MQIKPIIKLCDMKRDDNNFQTFIDRMEMAVLSDNEQVLLAGAKDDEPEGENSGCVTNSTPGCGCKDKKKLKLKRGKTLNEVPGCNCEHNLVCKEPKKSDK